MHLKHRYCALKQVVVPLQGVWRIRFCLVELLLLISGLNLVSGHWLLFGKAFDVKILEAES